MCKEQIQEMDLENSRGRDAYIDVVIPCVGVLRFPGCCYSSLEPPLGLLALSLA